MKLLISWLMIAGISLYINFDIVEAQTDLERQTRVSIVGVK